MMWSPLLGVQKPWWLVQGKRFQEEVLLWPPPVAVQHVGAVWVPCRSEHASGAGQPAEGGSEGWKGVPPLWEVKELQVPPHWEVQ